MDLYITCKCCGRLVYATSAVASGTKSICFDCATLPDVDKIMPLPKKTVTIKRTWTPEWDL